MMRQLPSSLLLALLIIPVPEAFAQPVCDQLVGKLLEPGVAQALQSLGCGDLAKVGIDNAEHRLTNICYSSAGAQSTLSLDATLKCRTSDAAFFQSELSETVSATATVNAADCTVVDVAVRSSGEIGQLLIDAFDVEGDARAALNAAIADLCR